MRQIKIYATINIDAELLMDDYHADTMARIQESVDELAEALDGEVEDLEIK